MCLHACNNTLSIFVYYNGDNNNYYGTGWHKILMKHDLMKMWWIKQKLWQPSYNKQTTENNNNYSYIAIGQLSSWNETII